MSEAILVKGLRARAQGYTVRAEKAVTNAQGCANPVKGRLAFDAERWFLGKMHPKKFGDATTIKHADVNGEKIEMDEVTRAARLAALAAQAGAWRCDIAPRAFSTRRIMIAMS